MFVFEQMQQSRSALPIPPPPENIQVCSNGLTDWLCNLCGYFVLSCTEFIIVSSRQLAALYPLVDRALCLLCGRLRTNPAALSVSGVVACYPCLHAHIVTQGRCPVTRLPCVLADIRKLYVDWNILFILHLCMASIIMCIYYGLLKCRIRTLYLLKSIIYWNI